MHADPAPDPLSEPPTVGTCWVTRFIRRHGYHVVRQKTLDAERSMSEDPEVIGAWFQQLKEIIRDNGIPPTDIWNMDETGFQIGVGKSQLCITKHRHTKLFAMPTNRETATAVEAISAAGEVVPAFLILKGVLHQSHWYQVQEMSPKASIGVSESGYTNDELSLEWL